MSYIQQILKATSRKTDLYGHLPPISKNIQIRRTRHAEHCGRSKNELISDVRQWTPTHRRACVGWPTWTFLQQLCTDTGCRREDLPEAMDSRDRSWERERERVREIPASSSTWWWNMQWNTLWQNKTRSFNLFESTIFFFFFILRIKKKFILIIKLKWQVETRKYVGGIRKYQYAKHRIFFIYP